MFTGIVTDVGTVRAIDQGNDIRRITIACAYDADGIDVGASIACAGVCLTVVARQADGAGRALVDVEAAPETMRLTNAGMWRAGTRINLERSLRLGDEMGGHMVAGHVDGLARVLEREDMGEAVRFRFAMPEELSRYIAPKGSVALDGTSLTVNTVDGNAFECLMVPHTLKVTTWADRHAGDMVHLEVDTVARYLARLAAVGSTQET